MIDRIFFFLKVKVEDLLLFTFLLQTRFDQLNQQKNHLRSKYAIELVIDHDLNLLLLLLLLLLKLLLKLLMFVLMVMMQLMQLSSMLQDQF